MLRRDGESVFVGNGYVDLFPFVDVVSATNRLFFYWGKRIRERERDTIKKRKKGRERH